MKHPKILPFLGIAAPGPSIQPTFISGPASGGTLREYVKKRPEADRIGLVGVYSAVRIPRLLRNSYPMSLRASTTSTLAV